MVRLPLLSRVFSGYSGSRLGSQAVRVSHAPLVVCSAGTSELGGEDCSVRVLGQTVATQAVRPRVRQAIP